MEMWDASGPVLPGVDAMVAPGHTPGSTIIVVSSKAPRALLLGDVVRTEAYRPNGDWRRCPGVIPQISDPVGGSYCGPPNALPTDAYDEDGEHYGVTEKRVPPVFASLMLPHLALRYAPITELAVKLEGALGFPMFFIGLSVAYAPEL